MGWFRAGVRRAVETAVRNSRHFMPFATVKHTLKHPPGGDRPAVLGLPRAERCPGLSVPKPGVPLANRWLAATPLTDRI